MNRNPEGHLSRDYAITSAKFTRRRRIRTLFNGKLQLRTKQAQHIPSCAREASAAADIRPGADDEAVAPSNTEAMGNEIEVVESHEGLWRNDYTDDLWQPEPDNRVTNSQFQINNENVGLYFSSADGFSGNFQVHFVQAAEQDRLPAAVCLFVAGLQERRLSYVCTSPRCTFSKSNLGLSYGTDTFVEHHTEFCEHAQVVMQQVLRVRAIVAREENITTQVLSQIDVPGFDAMGVYIADTDFGRKGRPIVFVDDSYEVEQVFYWNMQLWCHGCKSGKQNPCRHIRHAQSTLEGGCWAAVLKRLEEENSGVVPQDPDLTRAKQLAHQLKVEQEFSNPYIQPREMIRFSSKEYGKVVRQRGFELKKWMIRTYCVSKQRNTFKVRPEEKYCKECYTRCGYRKVAGQSYFCGSFMMPLDVYVGYCQKKECSRLGQEISYSGNTDFVVNYNNHLIIPIELVEEYLRYYAASALTVSAWWDEKTSAYTRSCMGSRINISLRQLRARRGQISTAIAGTAEMLNLASLYKCCDHPQTVSMDGIVLSTMRIAMPKFTKPWRMEGVERSRASHRSERQLPKLSEAERRVVGEVLQSREGISRIDLKSCLRSARNAALELFLTLCSFKENERGNCRCPTGIKEFGKFLQAEVAPVTSLIPYDYWDDFEEISMASGEQRQEHMRQLCVNAPQIYKLVVEVAKVPTNELKRTWKLYDRFVGQMKDIKAQIFAADEDELYRELSYSECLGIRSGFERKHPRNPDLNELWSTGCYFPNFPIVRVIKEVQLTKKERLFCHKEQAFDAGCMPGVLLFYCVEHECCIGFVVLDGAESPRVVYEVLATRFERLPQNVIYDNGCNLSEYVLNRTPYLFRRTQIMVDGFHFHSHKSCASCFSTEQNPRTMEKLNTSLFEQRNARLTKLKETAPLMRSRVFMAMVRMAVSNPNIKHKYKQLLERNKQRKAK
jgi:CxC4 like cysteine cluster associated with KDZ transposases